MNLLHACVTCYIDYPPGLPILHKMHVCIRCGLTLNYRWVSYRQWHDRPHTPAAPCPAAFWPGSRR